MQSVVPPLPDVVQPAHFLPPCQSCHIGKSQDKHTAKQPPNPPCPLLRLLHLFTNHNSHFQRNGTGGRHREAGFCQTGFCGSCDSRSVDVQRTDRLAWPGR